MQQKTKIKQRKSSLNNADRKYGREDKDEDEDDDEDKEEDASRKKLSSCLFYFDTNWKTLRAAEKLKWSCWSFLSDFRNSQECEHINHLHKL